MEGGAIRCATCTGKCVKALLLGYSSKLAKEENMAN